MTYLRTKHSHLTDAEFLRLISDRLGKSDIVDELYYRLEKSINIKEIVEETKNGYAIECPVCEAIIDLT